MCSLESCHSCKTSKQGQAISTLNGVILWRQVSTMHATTSTRLGTPVVKQWWTDAEKKHFWHICNVVIHVFIYVYTGYLKCTPVWKKQIFNVFLWYVPKQILVFVHGRFHCLHLLNSPTGHIWIDFNLRIRLLFAMARWLSVCTTVLYLCTLQPTQAVWTGRCNKYCSYGAGAWPGLNTEFTISINLIW